MQVATTEIDPACVFSRSIEVARRRAIKLGANGRRIKGRCVMGHESSQPARELRS